MTQKLAVGLTVVNALALIAILSQKQVSWAQSPPGVLRGSALEIVDQRGKVRASITIYPETSAAGNRTAYPEVVVLRLHDREGKPTVKLETHEAGGNTAKGSALGLLGAADSTQAFIGAEGAGGKVQLKSAAGQWQQVYPAQ